MNSTSKVKTIVLTGLLLALEVIFQTLGNYVQFGPANINLTLVTIVLAAVLCGPWSAIVLGFFNGVMAIFSPSTQAIFMPINPWATVLVCLLKTALAGLGASYIYKALVKKNRILALVLASIAVPVINTGLFTIGALLFFQPWLDAGSSGYGGNWFLFLLLVVIGWNFLLELATTVVVAPLAGEIVLRRNDSLEKERA